MDVNRLMEALDQGYSTVNGKKPRNSDRQMPAGMNSPEINALMTALNNNIRESTGQNAIDRDLSMRGLDAMAGGDLKQARAANNKDLTQKMVDLGLNFNPAAVAQTVWHGSPHKFDKFDMSKIGSGEGSQAYGHGFYVAEDQSVANSYKAMANKPGRRQAGLTSEGRDQSVLDSLIKLNARQFTGGDVNQLSELIARRPGAFDKPDQLIKRISEYEGNSAPSYMYKVDIPDDSIAKFLDIESDIPENLRQSLSASMLDKFGSGVSMGSGESAYKEVVNAFKVAGDPDYKNSAVKWMAQQGIPGLKFKDAGSRMSGEGTNNFVLFDDQMPRILEVNGQATGAKPWAKGEYK